MCVCVYVPLASPFLDWRIYGFDSACTLSCSLVLIGNLIETIISPQFSIAAPTHFKKC